jgi:hypothetical protein
LSWELRVPRKKPLVGSAPSGANKARDKVTQRMASSWRYLGPHQGDLASSSFVSESRSGGFLHVPSYGLSSSRLGSLDRDYPRTTCETSRPEFVPGVGGSAPIWSYEEGLCPCWLSPAYADPGSTQILIWHRSAKSQTVIQLMNVGTTPTRQVPGQFSPSRLSQHLRTGSVHMPYTF